MVRSIPTMYDKAISAFAASPASQLRFGEQVRALRERLGLSQEKFADTYDLSVANIRNWEQESRNVQPDSAARLIIEMIGSDPKQVADIVSRVRADRGPEKEERKAS